MIKNWIVKVKQIRNSGIKYKYKKRIADNGKITYSKISGTGRKVNNGFINHVNYLKDQNRPSHLKTKITVLLNNANNILNAIEERKQFRRNKGLVGGGVVNYTTSMVCVIPNNITQPNNLKEWSQIASQVIKDIASATKLPIQTIKKHTHIVLHDESASHDKHSHIHVLISNVINNEVVKSISQRKTTNAVKRGFNKSVKLILNEDNNDYIPKNKSKPDKPLWLARNEKLQRLEIKNNKLEAAVEQQQNKLTKTQNALETLTDTYQKIKIELESWMFNFVNIFWKEAEIEAKSVAKSIDMIEKYSKKSAQKFDEIVSNVEQNNTSAPINSKVSTHRKKRGRKR